MPANANAQCEHTLKGEHQPIILTILPRKLHEIEKELDQEGNAHA